MNDRSGSWRGVGPPSVLIGLAVVLLLVATVLDQRPPGAARELALTIGAPALTLVLPLGLIWLVVALVLRRRRR